MLIAIKLLHTFIWAAMAGSILALPVLAFRRALRWAAYVSVFIWLECAVLALNAGRCPLTDWAAHYTSDRASNFDIYLPLWLAQNNKLIFGVIFVAGECVLLGAWLWRRASERGKWAVAENYPHLGRRG